MQLFYAETISPQNTTYLFSKEESRHIIKVLRHTTGDLLHITDGRGHLFTATIIDANDKKCKVTIDKVIRQEPTPFHIHLAVAPTKMNDRYEWFLEKATEIGLSEITPIICEHSERKVVKTERFEKVLLSAMKQSQQFYLPKLNAPISYEEFIHQTKEDSAEKFIAHCDDLEKKSLKNNFTPNSHYILLIGPEGDFSREEIALAKAHSFVPVTLGQTRLRTETAAVVACHSFVYGSENE